MTKHRHARGFRPDPRPGIPLPPFLELFTVPQPPIPGGHGEGDEFRGRRPQPGGPGFRARGGRPPFDEGPHHRHGGRGRRRGDVRTAVLLLLGEESMHGYQLMQTITERTDGAWTPSPGAIYPTLSQLEDEGLVSIDTSGGRKQVSLTEAGRAYVEEHRAEWPNPLTTEDGPRLRELLQSLGEAVRQVGRTGTDGQRQQAAQELADARRRIYLILAGDEQSPAGQE